MTRLLPLAIAALLLPGAASGSTGTDLRITVWPQGPAGGAPHSWTLRCDPSGGTLPRAAEACRRLTALSAPFAPVPANAVCAQVYGGPQVATVRGTFRGRSVFATFKRTDSCQTARWSRVAFLFR